MCLRVHVLTVTPAAYWGFFHRAWVSKRLQQMCGDEVTHVLPEWLKLMLNPLTWTESNTGRVKVQRKTDRAQNAMPIQENSTERLNTFTIWKDRLDLLLAKYCCCLSVNVTKMLAIHMMNFETIRTEPSGGAILTLFAEESLAQVCIKMWTVVHCWL